MSAARSTPFRSGVSQQGPHGALARDLELRIQLCEGLESEAALGEARVRDGQPRLVHGLVAVEQQVEVDDPRAEARPCTALPAQLPLDREQALEELAG